MRKFKLLFLSALMVTGLVTFAACGMGDTNDTSKPPYEDETGTNNNTGNTGNTGNSGNNIGDDIKNGVDDIGDDIQNGIDNVEDGIQNGIDDMQNGIDNGIDNMQDGSQNNGGDMNRGHRTSRLEEAGQNLVNSVREASDAIREGLIQLSEMR